jgi:hypothetical protein
MWYVYLTHLLLLLRADEQAGKRRCGSTSRNSLHYHLRRATQPRPEDKVVSTGRIEALNTTTKMRDTFVNVMLVMSSAYQEIPCEGHIFRERNGRGTVLRSLARQTYMFKAKTNELHSLNPGALRPTRVALILDEFGA